MSAQTKEWKPRLLPNVKRHRVAPQKPWQAWVDPASGTMKYFDPNISVSIFYNRRPPGVTQVVYRQTTSTGSGWHCSLRFRRR